MARQNVYRYDDGEREFDGWFDREAATAYGEGRRFDGANAISLATGSQWEHETLYRTARGAWALSSWSQWEGSTPRCQYVSEETAREWLLRNEYPAEQVAEATGQDVEEERSPGRPEIGPQIKVRIPEDTLTQVDAAAAAAGVSRSAWIREAVEARLA